jgi:hypothetical protein
LSTQLSSDDADVTVVQCGRAGGGLDIELTTAGGQVRASFDEVRAAAVAVVLAAASSDKVPDTFVPLLVAALQRRWTYRVVRTKARGIDEGPFVGEPESWEVIP